jgi:hypothetical protein
MIVERAALDGVCVHIGLVPPERFPGGMPLSTFRGALGESPAACGPLPATQDQVRRWAADHSDNIDFSLIDREADFARKSVRYLPGKTFGKVLRMLAVANPVAVRELTGLFGLSLIKQPIDVRPYECTTTRKAI